MTTDLVYVPFTAKNSTTGKVLLDRFHLNHRPSDFPIITVYFFLVTDDEDHICLGLPAGCSYRALYVRHVHAFPARIQQSTER